MKRTRERTAMKPLTESEQFFFDHAGWAYDPKRETSEEGRRRCAVQLAAAEQWATARLRYEWSKDDITNKTALAPGVFPIAASEPGPTYYLDSVSVYQDGEWISSLGGVDFGYRQPRNQSPYKRVVEAELAVEPYLESLERQEMACRDLVTV